MKKRLWKCDDGTYDTVDDDGVADQNVPEHVLAEAPTLVKVLQGLLDTMETPRTRKATGPWQQAQDLLRRLA